MKEISAELDAHLSGDSNVCQCVKATLTNGTVFGFTSHDQDIIIDDGVGLRTYVAGAYTPTDVETSAALNVDNMEGHGMIDDGSITTADIEAGLWDYAQVQIFTVNYKDLTQGIMHQRVGTIGEVSLDRNLFRAEFRGLMQAYSRVIGELTSPGCRAIFGDARCKFPLNTVTFAATVLSVDADNLRISFSEAAGSPSAVHPSGYYDYGLVRFTSGLNAGLEMEIKSHTYANSPPAAEITLQLPMPYLISAGSPPDTMELVAGCAKRFEEDCRDRWDNVLNFRGEPHLRGWMKLVQRANQ